MINEDIALYAVEVLQLAIGNPKYRPRPFLHKIVRGDWLGKKKTGGHEWNKE